MSFVKTILRNNLWEYHCYCLQLASIRQRTRETWCRAERCIFKTSDDGDRPVFTHISEKGSNDVVEGVVKEDSTSDATVLSVTEQGDFVVNPHHSTNDNGGSSVVEDDKNFSKFNLSSTRNDIPNGAVFIDGGITKEIPPSRRPAWKADSSIDNCTGCSQKFTLYVRKHHCRNCGDIYCSLCCGDKIPLKHLDYQEPVRVCRSCVRRYFYDVQKKSISFFAVSDVRHGELKGGI